MSQYPNYGKLTMQEVRMLGYCFDEMMKGLLGRGWKVIMRPHPEFTKRYRPRWEALQARYEALCGVVRIIHVKQKEGKDSVNINKE